MSSAAAWAIVAFSTIETVVVLVAVRMAVGGMWKPLAAAYPAREPGEGAVRRLYQSYRIGIINLGFSVHTAVDADYLHLEPTRFVRLFGLGPVSVPWEDVEPLRLRGRRYAEVRIGRQTVMGPRWALGLVFGEGGVGSAEPDGVGPASEASGPRN